jgi:REP element-mobilizing transposase RayT
MSRLPRKFVFEPHEVGVYHCINRCVRRSMLCGWDPFTQRFYEHRKRWLQQRLMFLASVMAIDLEEVCTMANHRHLIVRNRPDVAAKWSPEQIARKWLQLCPPYKPGTREVAETPSQADLDAILNNPGRLEQLRLRLSNPSWLMRFLTESLARFANREDKTTGRFWEGRFKMQRLLDEWAVAACLVYVDLNPIRAGITTQLSESQHTSILERLAGVVHAFGKTLTAQQRRDSGLEADVNVRPHRSPAVARGGFILPQPAQPVPTRTATNPAGLARSRWRKTSQRRTREKSITVPCRRAPQAR